MAHALDAGLRLCLIRAPLARASDAHRWPQSTHITMSCLGVHFALTEKEAAHLRSLDDEQERLSHLQEVIEEHYLSQEKQFAAESDKSWDAMHRALADGEMSWDG